MRYTFPRVKITNAKVSTIYYLYMDMMAKINTGETNVTPATYRFAQGYARRIIKNLHHTKIQNYAQRHRCMNVRTASLRNEIANCDVANLENLEAVHKFICELVSL